MKRKAKLPVLSISDNTISKAELDDLESEIDGYKRIVVQAADNIKRKKQKILVEQAELASGTSVRDEQLIYNMRDKYVPYVQSKKRDRDENDEFQFKLAKTMIGVLPDEETPQRIPINNTLDQFQQILRFENALEDLYPTKLDKNESFDFITKYINEIKKKSSKLKRRLENLINAASRLKKFGKIVDIDDNDVYSLDNLQNFEYMTSIKVHTNDNLENLTQVNNIIKEKNIFKFVMDNGEEFTQESLKESQEIYKEIIEEQSGSNIILLTNALLDLVEWTQKSADLLDTLDTESVSIFQEVDFAGIIKLLRTSFTQNTFQMTYVPAIKKFTNEMISNDFTKYMTNITNIIRSKQNLKDQYNHMYANEFFLSIKEEELIRKRSAKQTIKLNSRDYQSNIVFLYRYLYDNAYTKQKLAEDLMQALINRREENYQGYDREENRLQRFLVKHIPSPPPQCHFKMVPSEPTEFLFDSQILMPLQLLCSDVKKLCIIAETGMGKSKSMFYSTLSEYRRDATKKTVIFCDKNVKDLYKEYIQFELTHFPGENMVVTTEENIRKKVKCYDDPAHFLKMRPFVDDTKLEDKIDELQLKLQDISSIYIQIAIELYDNQFQTVLKEDVARVKTYRHGKKHPPVLDSFKDRITKHSLLDSLLEIIDSSNIKYQNPLGINHAWFRFILVCVFNDEFKISKTGEAVFLFDETIPVESLDESTEILPDVPSDDNDVTMEVKVDEEENEEEDLFDKQNNKDLKHKIDMAILKEMVETAKKNGAQLGIYSTNNIQINSTTFKVLAKVQVKEYRENLARQIAKNIINSDNTKKDFQQLCDINLNRLCNDSNKSLLQEFDSTAASIALKLKEKTIDIDLEQDRKNIVDEILSKTTTNSELITNDLISCQTLFIGYDCSDIYLNIYKPFINDADYYILDEIDGVLEENPKFINRDLHSILKEILKQDSKPILGLTATLNDKLEAIFADDFICLPTKLPDSYEGPEDGLSVYLEKHYEYPCIKIDDTHKGKSFNLDNIQGNVIEDDIREFFDCMIQNAENSVLVCFANSQKAAAAVKALKELIRTSSDIENPSINVFKQETESQHMSITYKKVKYNIVSLLFGTDKNTENKLKKIAFNGHYEYFGKTKRWMKNEDFERCICIIGADGYDRGFDFINIGTLLVFGADYEPMQFKQILGRIRRVKSQPDLRSKGVIYKWFYSMNEIPELIRNIQSSLQKLETDKQNIGNKNSLIHFLFMLMGFKRKPEVIPSMRGSLCENDYSFVQSLLKYV